MVKKELIIAIDGPAGAGKSTLAKKLAEKLNYLYIDTGAMYRALTLKALRLNLDFEKEEQLVKTLNNTKIELVSSQLPGEIKIILDGEDVTKEIRDPLVNRHVSILSQIPEIRKEMLELQRKISDSGGVIMDGRDVGTVVLPHADLKFYVTANINSRAQRRRDDLIKQGYNVDLSEVLAELTERDKIDSNRAVAPLRPAENAIFIDTTTSSIAQNLSLMIKYIEKKRVESAKGEN
jgi:cytidylate kinase